MGGRRRQNLMYGVACIAKAPDSVRHGSCGYLEMKCYSVMLGARNTPSAGRKFRVADDKLIRAVTVRHFAGGFTILKSSGGWFDPQAGLFREEESRQILITAHSSEQLRPWCRALARALRQKEILVVELGRTTTYQLRGGGKLKK